MDQDCTPIIKARRGLFLTTLATLQSQVFFAHRFTGDYKRQHLAACSERAWSKGVEQWARTTHDATLGNTQAHLGASTCSSSSCDTATSSSRAVRWVRAVIGVSFWVRILHMRYICPRAQCAHEQVVQLVPSPNSSYTDDVHGPSRESSWANTRVMSDSTLS